MVSQATETRVKEKAEEFATVWVTAYEVARNNALGKGLPDVIVTHCAQQVADEVFNWHLQRIEDGEIG